MPWSRRLLVEDMTKILNYNRMALEKRGYRVTAVRTLSEARKRIEDAPPDLAVVDILLPDGSGLDLCRQLRHSDAPILLLTSLGDSDQIVRGLQAGGDDYIIKPYKIEELIAQRQAARKVEDVKNGQSNVPSRVVPRLKRLQGNHTIWPQHGPADEIIFYIHFTQKAAPGSHWDKNTQNPR